MSYYKSKTLSGISFEDTVEKVTELLKEKGFGVITQIDVQATFKKKINVDFRKYQILGACNPTFAHKALTVEDKIGTMLPCNIIVQETNEGSVEVAAIDPKASMSSVENMDLIDIADEIQHRLTSVIDNL